MKKTVYNGDVVDGFSVIEELNVDDLKAGEVHRFMFKGASMNTGQSWYVPVVVIKGEKPGKCLLLNSATHGDEVNGVFVIHRVIEQISPDDLSGSIIAVIGSGRQALERLSCNWSLNPDDVDNLNRLFPGSESGNTASQQAFRLYHGIFKQADIALDLHTQSTGTVYPFFIYADMRQDPIKTLATLFAADQIKNDAGEKGTLETTLVELGVPSITLELGKPRCYQKEIVNRAFNGICNVLVYYQMKAGEIGETAKTYKSYLGGSWETISSQSGGFTEILVCIGDEVEVGELVAIQKNAFAEVCDRYYASVSGRVCSVATDAVRGPSAMLVRILEKDS